MSDDAISTNEQEPSKPEELACECGSYAKPLGHRPACPVAVAERRALQTGVPKKPSSRKVLKRQLEARHRIYTPEAWAAEKAKEAELARLSRTPRGEMDAELDEPAT